MDKSLREMVCMMSIWWMCAWMLEGEGVVSSLPVKGETPMYNSEIYTHAYVILWFLIHW